MKCVRNMVTFDELIRYRNRQNRNRFNIIGISTSSRWRPAKSCVMSHVILIPRVDLKSGEDMPGIMCPKCDKPYEPTPNNIFDKFIT